MTFLPIVVRELRAASRRKRTYWARFWAALVAVGAGACVVTVMLAHDTPNADVGRLLFILLAFLCFIYCFSLAANTADCVSEEKREGTLGFLFLTDLKGYDVALGKLFSTSLNSLYAVGGILPIVGIALILGGVSALEFWEAALALLNFFFFAHTGALLMSTLCHRRNSATVGTAALLLGYTLGLFLLASVLTPVRFAFLSPICVVANPGYSLLAACEQGMPGGGPPGLAARYWHSLLIVHLNAWLFLALASWKLPHCWQEKPTPTRLRWRERFRQWTFGPPAIRRARRRNLLTINPFLWLVSRNRLGPLFLWSVLIFLAVLWVVLMYLGGPNALVALAVGALIVNHFLLLGGVALDASRELDEQKRSGALEFLLCATPLRVSDILDGHWLALRRQYFRPLLAVLTVDLVLTEFAFRRGFSNDVSGLEDRHQFAWVVATALALLILQVYAAGWIGMWRAMVQTKHRAAAMETVGLLVFIPGVAQGAISALVSFFAPEWLESFWFPWFLWVTIWLAAALGFSLYARQIILTRFRLLASTQTEKPLGILARIGRKLGSMAR